MTSVHPRYYARNLKNYTDTLVYIPYFTLGEIEQDDVHRTQWIDEMRHFCFMPGTIYAHKVIIQSENMRKIYIDEYTKEAKTVGLSVNSKELEEKILGLGSPKYDKVDNTGISALLKHDEKWLDKIEDVLKIFKENKDEVVLLWRLHSLIQATIESMWPELWEGYREIRDRCIEEGWGIYDDTTDLDRAVVVSDAYYGDGSSVVQLCHKAGMPIMLQNVVAGLR